MNQLTEKQKQIYNLYLKSYRQNKNEPFRAKKNFSDIEKDEKKIFQLAKIEKIFQKYPAFSSQKYFDAPYKIYNDEKPYYSLSFYSSQKGISTCLAFLQLLKDSEPETQFEFFKESYKFIAKFCIEKEISFSEYPKFCSVAQNDCLIHLKQHKISWYVVFSIPEFYNLLYNLPKDEFELYFGSSMNLQNLYNKYQGSQKTKEFLSKVQEKIARYIRKQLQRGAK
jgi:hypothetical protein